MFLIIYNLLQVLISKKLKSLKRNHHFSNLEQFTQQNSAFLNGWILNRWQKYETNKMNQPCVSVWE